MPKTPLVWVTMVLITAMLACALPGGPKPPASPIPVSTEAAGQLQENVATALAAATETGQVSLTLTEAQITSYVTLKMAEQPTAPIQDLQIFLREGTIQIFGTVEAGQVTATAHIVLSATISSAGQPVLNLKQADFGPLPVPESLLDSITSSVKTTLMEQIGSDVNLTAVTIQDGEISISGNVVK